jgi:dTDP-4-dehydrorhamnose reductase
MKVLITGANGFVGYYIVRDLLNSNYTVIATGRGTCRLPFKDTAFTYVPMDFTDPFSIHDVFETYKPDVVVHAGAMSQPDACELNQADAYMVNVEGTVHLLTNAEEQKCFFVYLSTDFVFDGKEGMYAEDDKTGPVNYYGRTKLEAEEAVKEYPYQWAIVRTVLVYGRSWSGRHNIVTLIKSKLEKGEEYNVVDDQFRTPTYVEDLSRGITTIVQKKATGVFHLSGKDVLTPYQLAIRTADHLSLSATRINRVTASSFSQPAKRPQRTGFKIEKARRELGYEPVSIDEGLKRTFS